MISEIKNVFTCTWKSIDVLKNINNCIQIADGDEDFHYKLLHPPKDPSILLKYPDLYKNENENELKEEKFINCWFTMNLNIDKIRIKPIGWFLITESQFIEIYSDSMYLQTFRGKKVDPSFLEYQNLERNYKMYEHQINLPCIEEYTKTFRIKFLGLPGDKKSVYISEWIFKINIKKEELFNNLDKEYIKNYIDKKLLELKNDLELKIEKLENKLENKLDTIIKLLKFQK